MPNPGVDLTNCDREPIHIPGQIQSHGFLIVLDGDYVIQFFSDNISSFLENIPFSLLGQPLQYLEQLIGAADQPVLITQLMNVGKANGFEQTNPFKIDIAGTAWYLNICNSDKYYLLEFEPSVSDFNLDIQKMIGRSVSEMLADKNLQKLLNNTAAQVKKIIQYDRVMIYRFAEDGHGEVVAESKEEYLQPWLGLHYPASDIPKQARELYKLNLTRLIADVYSLPSKITTDVLNTQPLDLTYSQLRAVSPIHIQYLKNMGVASSFSISLLYKNELWGLIACHNYTPRFIDYKSRESSKLLGQILSSALEFRQDEENQQLKESFQNSLDKLTKSLQKNDSIEEALNGNTVNFLEVVNAGGGVLVYEKNITKLGITPDDEQLHSLISWMKTSIPKPVYHTHQLSAVFPEALAYSHIASGMLLCVLSRELEEYIIWFKPEQIHNIVWGGNPEKPVENKDHNLLTISPRRSFENWSQEVSATAVRWTAEEINSVTRLKEEIAYALNLKAGAIRILNEKLRLAYEELDTFSFTISHDLKNPISAVKNYAQILSMDKTIGEFGQKILLRIEERADKMNFMINAVLDYSRIGRLEIEYHQVNTLSLINGIIKDLDLAYGKQNLEITVGKTPDLKGDPVMLTQVFSNLIGNAVKYSQNNGTALIHIEGEAHETGIKYTVRDNGLGIAADNLTSIFELFNRMDNVKEIEGSGVGLAIVKRIVEKHKGRIWAESELGKGSTFFIWFNH